MVYMKFKLIPLVLSLHMLGSCGNKNDGQVQERELAQAVSIIKISNSKNDEVFHYSGTLEADNTVDLGFGVPGRVTVVNVQEGQHVAKGQLLASIEQNTYQNNLSIGNATLEQAEDNFKRMEQMYKKNSLPERDYISAKLALAQAKAARSSAQKNLQDTKLYAPFSGIVTRKLNDAGAIVNPGVPSFTIVKTDNVYATASITESEVAALHIGAPAEIFIPSLDIKLVGKVSLINPKADDMSKTYQVKIRLNNPDGHLFPGMITDMTISTGRLKEGIVIPVKAVLRDTDNSSYVFIVGEKNHAVKRRLVIGAVTGVNSVFVNQGLTDGDRLITNGQTKLDDGTPVTF